MAALLTTLSTHVTAPVNFYLMKGLLSAARKKLPYLNGTMPGKLEKNQGAYSVKWERIENLTAVTTALAEPVGNATFANGRDAVRPTVTALTVTMAKYGNAITLQEEVDLIQVNTRSMQFLETLGRNAGESLNGIAQTQILAGLTNIRYGNGVASAALTLTAISLNDIKFAVNQLDRNDAMTFTASSGGSANVGSAPIRESYYGICHPDVKEDIRLISGFNESIKYESHVQLLPGEFGEVGGVRFCATTLGAITVGAGTTSAAGFRGATNILNNVYDTIIYGQECIGSIGLGENHSKETMEMGDHIPAVKLIQKAPGSSGIGDMYDEVGSLAWKSFFAVKVLNAAWGYRLRTLAADI